MLAQMSMKTKFRFLLAGAALIVLAGVANAGQTVVLSDTQMDRVTAGTSAAATAVPGAVAMGDLFTFTQTASATNAVPDLSAFGGTSAKAAAGSSLFPALAASSGMSTATIVP